jgi:hypothetical protein
MRVDAFAVDTGTLCGFGNWSLGDVSGGFSDSRAVGLPGCDGSLVRVEISWMNSSVSSGATIEVDGIYMWDAD